MAMTPEEIGRMMMTNAGNLDDDIEFNRWAKLGTKLIMNPGSLRELTPEEQQVISRAMNRFVDQHEVA